MGHHALIGTKRPATLGPNLEDPMSFLQKMFGGGVDAEDPRRYLIETMLAAIGADGEVTEEEVMTLDKTLEEHDLFRDISSDARNRLMDSATEALREAGGGMNRLEAIAKGLPGRTHQQTAYAMACEICVADADLPDSEIRFLDALQKALQLDDATAKELFEAARNSAGLKTVEEKTLAMREMMPRFVDCMALMAAADGEIHDDELISVRAVLASIPDMAVLNSDELNDAIVEAFNRVKDSDLGESIKGAADVISEPVDRYWTIVYMMIICLADGKADWREVAFLSTTRDAFGLDDELMDHAMAAASKFPATELGGAVPQ
jgi:uncharacterized tellurite resistance protein B-like protein